MYRIKTTELPNKQKYSFGYGTWNTVKTKQHFQTYKIYFRISTLGIQIENVSSVLSKYKNVFLLVLYL